MEFEAIPVLMDLFLWLRAPSGNTKDLNGGEGMGGKGGGGGVRSLFERGILCKEERWERATLERGGGWEVPIFLIEDVSKISIFREMRVSLIMDIGSLEVGAREG